MNAYVIPGIIRDTPEVIIEKTIEKIISAVGGYLELTSDEIKQRGRRKELVIARQYCMYFMKYNTNFSLRSIGESFGSGKPFDHTTVIYSIGKIDDFISINDEITIKNIEAINKRLM